MCAENLIQQEKLEQQIIEERYRQEEEKRRRRARQEAMPSPHESDSSASASFSPQSPPEGCFSPQTKTMSPVPAQDFPGHTQQNSPYESVPIIPLTTQYSNIQTNYSEKTTSVSSSLTSYSTLQLQATSNPSIHSLPTCPTKVSSDTTSPPILAAPMAFEAASTPDGTHTINQSNPPALGSIPSQSNFSLFPNSPPISSVSVQKLPQILPAHILSQLLPKPFVSVPNPNYSFKPLLGQTISTQEKASNSVTGSNLENALHIRPASSASLSGASSLFHQQLQKPPRAQSSISPFFSSFQKPEICSAHPYQRQEVPCVSPHIKYSPQRMTSPLGNQKRATSSSQKIIPPLPKTVFPEDKIDYSKFSLTPNQQSVRANQEHLDCHPQLHHTKEDVLEPATQSHHLSYPTSNSHFSNPQIFSPPLNSPPPVSEFSGLSFSAAPKQTFSPQAFHFSGYEQLQEVEVVNSQLLSKKLQALQQSEDISSSSQSSIHAQMDLHTNQERKSQSQEREPLTVEEYKQRQLKKLIEEKVRLEEMMMIAKRRQSVSEATDSPEIKKKDIKEKPPCIPFSPPSQTNAITAKKQDLPKEECLYENVNPADANVENLKISSSEIITLANKNHALREGEEEEKLRKENHMRDEKIRRMQERRYEEKLKRDVSRSGRDKSCPPFETDTSQKDKTKEHLESNEAGGRKSRERTRENRKGKLVRERSCPINIGQQIETSKEEEQPQVLQDQPSLARSVISAHLRSLNIGNSFKSSIPTDQNPNVDSAPKTLIRIIEPQFNPNRVDHNNKINTNETIKNIQTLQQKKYLIDVLKKDQQRIQEKFERTSDVLKEKSKEPMTSTEKKVKLAPEQLQYEAQRWHAELQMQEEINKEEESKRIEFLELQEQNKDPQDEIRKIRKPTQEEIQKEILEQEETKQKEQKQLLELKKQCLVKQELFTKGSTQKIQENLNLQKRKQKEEMENLKRIRKQEKEKQQELQKREEYLKLEEEKLIQRIIQQEQKRILEEQKRRKDENNKRLLESAKSKSHTIDDYCQKNKACQASSIDEDKIIPSIRASKEEEEQRIKREREEEINIEDLRRQEEEKMKEEVRLYKEYKKHLESKRNKEIYDSDDYASEWETGEEDEEGKRPRGVYLKERFDELKATSEEELYDAQEKSIRNLERQIRKQKQREMRKNYERRQQGSSDSSKDEKKLTKPSSRSVPSSQHRQYSSTGDLRSNPSRTLPITKFSPDPMEFGFRPIETPHSIISRSTGNLMTGGGPSASSIAHVAGAEAGVAAVKKPISRKLYYQEDFTPKETWDNRYRISSSLEDLQQVF